MTEEEQEVDVDVMEISLTEDEIDELILKLDDLKETKQHIHFEIDDENEMIINYDNGEEE